MIDVRHYVATLHASFPGNIAPDVVAQWVNDSTAELVREMRRQFGPYFTIDSHTITTATAGVLLRLINTMVGQADEWNDDEPDDDDENDDAPAPEPDPAPPCRRGSDCPAK